MSRETKASDVMAMLDAMEYSEDVGAPRPTLTPEQGRRARESLYGECGTFPPCPVCGVPLGTISHPLTCIYDPAHPTS